MSEARQNPSHFREIAVEAQWAARWLTMAIVDMPHPGELRNIAIEKAKGNLTRLIRLIPDDVGTPETMTINARAALEIVECAVSGEADDPGSLVPVLRVVERVTGWADAVADMTAEGGQHE